MIKKLTLNEAFILACARTADGTIEPNILRNTIRLYAEKATNQELFELSLTISENVTFDQL